MKNFGLKGKIQNTKIRKNHNCNSSNVCGVSNDDESSLWELHLDEWIVKGHERGEREEYEKRKSISTSQRCLYAI